jgi:bacterioferritin
MRPSLVDAGILTERPLRLQGARPIAARRPGPGLPLPRLGDRIEFLDGASPLPFSSEEDIMKGDPKLIKVLNSLLADELTAINQYMVHSEMCDNWGYDKLHKTIEKRAIDEMKHAEKLIGRILFLEGLPIVSDLKKLFIGADVPKMFASDHKAEDGAIKSYNEAIILAGSLKDYATREILESILKDEDAHIDGIEEVLDQIGQMGLQIFLTTQVG